MPKTARISTTSSEKPLDISQVGKLVEEQAEIGALPPFPAPAAPHASKRRSATHTGQVVIFRRSRLRVPFMAERSGSHAALARGMQATLGNRRSTPS